MKYLLQNQSAFALKKVIRQGNGNYVMTVKVIDQTGTHRQLVTILKETKVAMLNESQKKGNGSRLNSSQFLMVHTYAYGMPHTRVVKRIAIIAKIANFYF